jgi:DNA-binding NarL/FixJ family response regulator
MTKSRILLVDDDEACLELLQGMLEDDFDVLTLVGAELTLGYFEETLPDALIFNPRFVRASFSELCEVVRRLRPPCYMVCLADREDLADSISFYECGVDDYLPKPFNPVALYHKIKGAVDARLMRLSLADQADNARSMAFSMMEANSELGTLLRCIEQIMASRDFDALGSAMLGLADEFDVTVAIQLRSEGQRYNFRCEDESLEAKVLTAGRSKPKVVESRGRLIMNQSHVSLLVTALEGVDPNRYGRLKDNLAIMMNTAESRIESLARELSAEARRAEIIKGVTDHVGTSMEAIRDQFGRFEESVWKNVMKRC